MRIISLLLLMLVSGFSGFSQFLSGDCCTCYAYEYGSQSNYFRDSSLYLMLNRETEDWQESSFARYNYDNRRLSETVSYYFDHDNYQRVGSFMQIKTPDPENKNIKRLQYRWDKDFQNWKESSRSVSYYKENKKLSHTVNFKYDELSADWVKNIRNESTSNSKLSATSNAMKKWVSGKWLTTSENNCTDDLVKLQRTCISSSLNEETGLWETSRKTLYQYNTDMRLAQMFLYNFNKETNFWKPIHESKYEYDQSGRKLSWFSWNYNKDTGEKKYGGHQQYIYDKHGNNTEVLSLSLDKTTKEWRVYRKQINYWSIQIEEKGRVVLSGTLKVYPNPFADRALLNLSGISNIKKMELLNLNGKVVRNYKVKGNKEELVIEKNELMPGMYIIKISADKIYTGRIIIR